MKNIAIYLDYEPFPKQGGMERATDLLARMLSLRYRVILICKFRNRSGENYTPPVPIFYLPSAAGQQQAAFIALLQENQIELLIDQCEGNVIGRYGIFRYRSELACFMNVKYIAVQHSSVMSALKNYHIVKQKDSLPQIGRFFYNKMILPCCKWRAYKLQEKLAADLNRNYDKIVTLSDSFIPHFYTLAPQTTPNKVIAIPNSNTYEEKTAITSANKVVLFVGRLDNKTKGVDRLLRIWNKVEPHANEWTLKIVGDGQDRQMLEKMAADLQLTSVSFEGFQQPKPYYETASVFCMTSTIEGFGMVLTEAMQHGVVPIAFNSYDALKDIVTDLRDGVIVRAFDEDIYAAKLLELITNKKLWGRLSEQAIQSSSKFSKDKVAQKWYDLIDSME